MAWGAPSRRGMWYYYCYTLHDGGVCFLCFFFITILHEGMEEQALIPLGLVGLVPLGSE